MRGILDPGQAERAQEDKHSLPLISQVVSQYNHNAHLISHNHNAHTENHQDGAACQELRYLFPRWCLPKRHQYPDRQLSICMTLGNQALSKARAGYSLFLLAMLQEADAGNSMDGLNGVAPQFTLGYFS